MERGYVRPNKPVVARGRIGYNSRPLPKGSRDMSKPRHDTIEQDLRAIRNDVAAIRKMMEEDRRADDHNTNDDPHVFLRIGPDGQVLPRPLFDDDDDSPGKYS